MTAHTTTLPNRPRTRLQQGLAPRIAVGSRLFVWPVTGRPEYLCHLRAHLRALLVDQHVPQDTVDDTLLVVSELVTNAVVHALPPVVLQLSLDRRRGSLSVAVTDGSPRCRPHDALPDEHGRGLGIVSALTARNGTTVRPSDVTHWAEMTWAGAPSVMGRAKARSLPAPTAQHPGAPRPRGGRGPHREVRSAFAGDPAVGEHEDAVGEGWPRRCRGSPAGRTGDGAGTAAEHMRILVSASRAPNDSTR